MESNHRRPFPAKPLVHHVWERCTSIKACDTAIVATHDLRIAEAAFAFGAEGASADQSLPGGVRRGTRTRARRAPAPEEAEASQGGGSACRYPRPCPRAARRALILLPAPAACGL